MKKLFIIRHAKSDQRFFGNDFERPLNERGSTDAPAMAKRLLEKKCKIDALVSSPAVRVKKTAELFAETLGIPADGIIFISALYHASPEIFYHVVASLPDSINNVAVFSHNPGITYFINSLNTDTKIDNLPTCGTFAVTVYTEKWSNFIKAKKEFSFFDYPKMTI